MAARLKKVVLITAGLMAMAAARPRHVGYAPATGLELSPRNSMPSSRPQRLLQAEMSADYRKVYSLLAPSSPTENAHYEEFLQDMSDHGGDQDYRSGHLPARATTTRRPTRR